MNLQFRARYTVIFLAGIVLLSVLAYSNTFLGEFQFDDDSSVVENPYVTDISKFSGLNLAGSAGNGFRPVTAITFALNYQFGRLDVRWYHITNFIIHIFNGMLIFYLVLLTMRSPKLPVSTHSRSLSVAIISSAIFLLHPIQTEAVSYISQRYESLASFFCLCSLIAYIKAVNAERGNSAVFLYGASVLSYILAMGSKEIAVTIPVIILLYDFYFLKDRPFLRRITGPGIFIVLSLMAGIYILIGFSKGIDAGFSVKSFTPWEYLMTQFRVLTAYIRLLFIPVNQNLDYDFRVSKSFFEAGTLLSLIFLLTFIVFAAAVFRRWRIGSFFVLWFFIIIAPTSSVIPIIDLIFEHRVYLASAGFFVIVSDAFSKGLSMLAAESTLSKISVPLIIVLMVLLAGTTFERNRVWETKLSLWEDVAKKSPMKSRVHNNLGNCYMLLNRYFEAIEEYKKAVNLDKNNVEAYYNLGINLDNVGLLKQAVYYYDIFYRIAPEKYDAQKKIARARIESFNAQTRRSLK